MIQTARHYARAVQCAVAVALLASSLFLTACSSSPNQTGQDQQTLEVMSNMWQKNLEFEQKFFQSFAGSQHIAAHYVPNASLTLYKKLLEHHTRRPDLLELDVVWPSALAEHLIDLRPYLRPGAESFSPASLATYTVNGRLVAFPLMTDIGVLYYRQDLLAKYGFDHPPRTWGELEQMASRIQDGERNSGRKNFWGFLWQGALSEGLTCNAVEWQSSGGGGSFVTQGGSANVANPLFEGVLLRAVGWLGRISPPAEYAYREDDSMNLWNAGQTAFMRNWASAYGRIADFARLRKIQVGVTALPAGPGGARGAMGGIGMGISKYASNPEIAIQALLALTSQSQDLQRFGATQGIPTHTSLLNRPDIRASNALLSIAPELMAGASLRPTGFIGRNYNQASRAYASAINSVLRRQVEPHAAMVALDAQLTALMSKTTPPK